MYTALSYSCLAGLGTLLGTILLFLNESRVRRYSILLVGFSAGVMVAVTFLHLLPEGYSLSSQSGVAILTGIVCFYLLEHIILFHPCTDEQCVKGKLGLISVFGLVLHSLLDGLIMAVSFNVKYSLGMMTTLAVILHEVPEGITTTSILMHAGLSRKLIWIWSVLVAIATPLGTIISYLFIRTLNPEPLGILLSFTAGSFIYIAIADLLPEVHRTHRRYAVIFLLLGIFTVFIISRFMGEL